jgi:hypothetical protein
MASPRSGSTGVLEVKGDVLVFDGTDLERLPVGADGSILRAQAAQPQGLKWDVPDDIPGIGIPLMFGANFQTVQQIGRYCAVNGVASATNTSSLEPYSEAVVLKDGNLTRFGWNTVGGGIATGFNLVKNGIVIGGVIYLTAGPYGAVTGLSVPMLQGDLLAIQYADGPPPGESHFQLFIE